MFATFLKNWRTSLIGCLVLLAVGCAAEPPDQAALQKELNRLNTYWKTMKPNKDGRIMKDDKEWKEQLSSEEYYVTRQKGTERPGTGELLHNKATGTYLCKCCGEELFASDTKFNSGTGWPSFYDKIGANVAEIRDTSHGMVRTEVVCHRCDAHLGHVFPDGPKPTGLRYCINSVSLAFKPSEDPKDEQ